MFEIRPPVDKANYPSVYQVVNQALNDERFGNSSARVAPLLDRITQDSISDLYIFTREGFSFSVEQVQLLLELTKVEVAPTTLKFKYQT